MRTLLEQFQEASKYRKKLRKEIIKIIRQYKNLFHSDGWILYKMENNYMGDLSDNHLRKYLEFIIENRKK
jgi:hypothetical protein